MKQGFVVSQNIPDLIVLHVHFVKSSVLSQRWVAGVEPSLSQLVYNCQKTYEINLARRNLALSR